jgi:hypothetical protein
MESSVELSKLLMMTHDIMLEWIGYFNWLCVTHASGNNTLTLKLSKILKTSRIYSFCQYLSKFSNTLRGVCIDFDLHSISTDLLQQWTRYHVPCHIIVVRNGVAANNIPSQYTVLTMAARKRSPCSSKLSHYAIKQQADRLKIWVPPKRT